MTATGSPPGPGPTCCARASPAGCGPPYSPSATSRWGSTVPETREHAETAAKAFAADCGATWPKAAAKITDDLDVPLEFYNYPAAHWVHLRTTNPIAFKLIGSARTRWRTVNAPHLVALVRAGAPFEKGILVERPDEEGGEQQVA